MSADLTFTAAMVQMRTGLLPPANLEQGTKLIREAAAQGADYVLTPEVSNMMQSNRTGAVRASRRRRRRSFAEGLSRAGGGTENPSPYRLAGAARLAGAGGQPLVPDRAGRHGDRELRQDPHVRYRSARRRELSRIRQLPAGRNRRDLGPALGPHRPHDLLRRAFSGAVSRARRKRRVVPHRAFRLHGARPAKRIGTRCCAPAPSRTAASCSPPPRPALHENKRETYGHSLIVDPWGDHPGRRRRHRARRFPGQDRSRESRDRAQDRAVAAAWPALQRRRPQGRPRASAPGAGIGMIRYNLRCERGHAFESWFQSSQAYETQEKRKLVNCPVLRLGQGRAGHHGPADREQEEPRSARHRRLPPPRKPQHPRRRR